MKRTLPLLLVALAFIAVVMIWVGTDKRVPRQTFDSFSSENTSDEGLSLAYRYLKNRGGRPVSKLTRAVDPRKLPSNGVVFRVGKLFSERDFFDDDDEESSKKKKKPTKLHLKRKTAIPILSGDEEEWIRRGGRLVLAIGRQYAGLDIRNTPGKRATKVFPIWQGLDTLDLAEPRTLVGDAVLRSAHSLYTIDNAPAMSRVPLGSGDLIVLGSPETFTNKHVGKNLALLTALAGDRRPVLFDEYYHGESADEGALALMKDWNLGPFLLLGLFGFILALWRNGISLGPREDDFRDTRSEAVDLVSSLGALYERGMTSGESIALYHQALVRAVAAQSGLRGEPLHRRVNEMTGYLRVPGKQEKLDADSFKGSLAKLNDAFGRIEK